MNLGSLNAAFGAGASIGWISQRLQGRAPHTAIDRDDALGVGAFARFALTLPLQPGFGWQLEALLQARFFREDHTAIARSSLITGELGAVLLSGPSLSF